MEHKWGRNVFEYGLGLTESTLASRLLAGPPGYILCNGSAETDTHLIALIPTDTSLPYVFDSFPDIPGHPHFPYGHSVEADAPV